jgi:acylphosphatase
LTLTQRAHVFISGRVQGVGFRYAAYTQAQALGLNGWVRNVPDGRVEAEFEGLSAAVETMIAWCHEGPRFSRVDDVAVVREEGVPKHTDFRLKS